MGLHQVVTLFPDRLRRRIVLVVIISMVAYRRFDTQAEVVVNFWTVGGGTVTIARLRFDPEGPMGAREAALECLERAAEKLRPVAPRGSGHEEPELPLGDD